MPELPGLRTALAAVALGLTLPAAAVPTINPNFVSLIAVDGADRDTLLGLLYHRSDLSLAPGAANMAFNARLYWWDHVVRFDLAEIPANGDPYTVIDPEFLAPGLFADIGLWHEAPAPTCFSQIGRQGSIWQYAPSSGSITQVTLCSNQNTPFYMRFDFGGQGSVGFNFLTFSPGIPSVSNFCPLRGPGEDCIFVRFPLRVPEPASLALALFALAAAGATLRRTGGALHRVKNPHSAPAHPVSAPASAPAA